VQSWPDIGAYRLAPGADVQPAFRAGRRMRYAAISLGVLSLSDALASDEFVRRITFYGQSADGPNV
jgi:hypothetical protein